MADEWSQYAVQDEWSQYAESKSKLTGNPTIDMVEPNKAVEEAKKNIIPEGIGSIPGVYAKSAGDIIGGAVNAITHPVDTSKALLQAVTHPFDALSGYIKGRYDTGENIARTMSTDPFGVLMDATVIGGLTKSGIKAGAKAIKVSKVPPEQMVAKAEGITQRILNPSKDVIADSLLKNSKIPAVREAAKVIRKSKTEKDLLLNIDDSIKTNFNARDKILKSNNYRMTDNHIKELEDFIQKRKIAGQINPSELRQMENVLSEEKAWYVKNKDNFDRISGQSRKEYLQDITDKLLVARDNGAKVITQPARKQALDVLRSGLMKGVEGNDLRVRDLNSTYAGLKDAKEMLANQAAIVSQNANKGVVERLLLMAQSATNPQAAAINIALRNAKNISKLSGKVESLMSQAMSNRVKMVIDEAVKNEKILGLPNLTPKYLQERINMSPKDLSIKGKYPEKGIAQPEPPIQIDVNKPSQVKRKGRVINSENKYTPKQILDESYKAAIEAKKKRMIDFNK